MTEEARASTKTAFRANGIAPMKIHQKDAAHDIARAARERMPETERSPGRYLPLRQLCPRRAPADAARGRRAETALGENLPDSARAAGIGRGCRFEGAVLR